MARNFTNPGDKSTGGKFKRTTSGKTPPSVRDNGSRADFSSNGNEETIVNGSSVNAAALLYAEKKIDVPKEPVVRKAPPTLERDSYAWEAFEHRVLLNPVLSASEAKARAIATTVHRGQTDQIGADYIDHPKGVVELTSQRPEYAALSPEDQEVARQAAWLHDTLEDTALVEQDLRDAGFSEKVISTIEAVTARDGEPKPEYYERVKAAGPIAVAVKLGDLSHNNLPERRESLPGSPSNPVAPEDVGNPSVDRWTKLGRKYYLAYQALGAKVPPHLEQFAPVDA